MKYGLKNIWGYPEAWSLDVLSRRLMYRLEDWCVQDKLRWWKVQVGFIFKDWETESSLSASVQCPEQSFRRARGYWTTRLPPPQFSTRLSLQPVADGGILINRHSNVSISFLFFFLLIYLFSLISMVTFRKKKKLTCIVQSDVLLKIE